MFEWFPDLVRDDRVPAWVEIEASPSYQRTPDNRKRSLAERALLAGRRAAERFEGAGAFDLARSLQVAWRVSPEDNRMGAIRRHAEYNAIDRSVVIYEQSIDFLHRALLLLPDYRFDEPLLEELLLAHELYHHLTSGILSGFTSRMEGEIGAHAFAKRLTSFPFLPCAADRVAMVTDGRLSEEELHTAMLQAAEIMNTSDLNLRGCRI